MIVSRFLHLHEILIEGFAFLSLDSLQDILLLVQLAVLEFGHKVVHIHQKHDYADDICLYLFWILCKLGEEGVEQILIRKFENF